MLLDILPRTGQPTQGPGQPQASTILSLGIGVYGSTVPDGEIPDPHGQTQQLLGHL